MSCSSRGKWSAVGSLVSAPVRGYYYPGHIKATKRSVDGSSLSLYSVAFSNPLDSLEEPGDKGLILDFTADQLIGRGFEPITRTLLSENQKVFITYRGREVSARVDKHDTTLDEVSLVLDSEPYQMTVRLHEIRLLPSRKSGRIQEHPDYSLLANGRRSPDQDPVNGGTKPKSNGGRRRTISSSSLLLPESSEPVSQSSGTIHPASARIDVPAMQSGRKRRPSNSNVMDECAAALVLMSLSASPRSPTFFTEQPSSSKIYKCTWPHCVHETLSCSDIEKHVREDHLRKLNDENDEEMSGEEEFYYTEVDANQRNGWKHPPTSSVSTSFTHSSGPESPVSLSEDAASTSSGSVGMTNGDNSMDSSPPSPITNNTSFFKSNSAFMPVYYPHLEDHEYNRRPDPAGISILGKGNNRISKKNLTNSPSILSSGVTSHPINIPNMDQNENQPLTMSASFGGFSGSSSLSSGFGSYTSFGSSFSPVSPPRSSGSLSSSLSSASNKYLRISAGRTNSSGTTILQNGALNRTSPTKRVRGETRKCRKIYGMEKKEAWCTQCKWKKACTRFLD